MIYLFKQPTIITEPPPPLATGLIDQSMSNVSTLRRKRSRDRAIPMLSTIQFSVATATIGAGGILALTLIRSGNVELAADVTLVITPGSANSSDYGTLSSSLVVFPAGSSNSQIVTLNITNDSDSVNESFSVTAIAGLNSVIGAIATITVTITPAISFGTLTNNYISRLTAKNVSLTTAKYGVIDTHFYAPLISNNFISASPATTDELQDVALFLIDPSGLTVGDCQKIAETKLLKLADLPDFNLEFFNVNNSNFSMSLGLSPTIGANGTKFNTKVPANFGVAGSSARGRSLGAWLTAAATENFASILNTKSTSPNPASEFGLRIGGTAASTVGTIAKVGAIVGTVNPYTERCLFSTIRSDGAVRTIQTGSEVGTTATETIHDPGTSKIWGCVYAENDTVFSNSYNLKIAAYFLFKAGLTAARANTFNTIMSNFITQYRAA